jgi:dTDP-4-dehydrorhamnose reductase
MKIAIFGVSGFLGTKLKEKFEKKGHKICGGDLNGDLKSKTDATDFKEVSQFLNDEKPDFIINTIGLTSSVECEKDPKRALALNYQTAKNIAACACKMDIPLVFISSSYVFDGLKGNYSEEDTPNPLNEYGKTKVMAENEIIKLKKGIVIRVDLMYGFNGLKKPNGVFQKILKNEVIEINNSKQIRQPVLVDDIPGIILTLIKNKSGIFHVAGPDKVLMIDFMKILEKIIRNKTLIKETNKKNLVKIPENSTLNISKIGFLGLKTTSIKQAVKLIKKQINSE